MTFEEFFNKKRIDLGLMRDADPALYSEFKSHFESMGEKSFDHTKKFWFNKLRHLYHLAEPVKKVVTQVETQIASQAEPLSSPTMEQNVPAAQGEAGEEAKAPALPKPGFRPRSIPVAAVKKQEQAAQAEPDVPADKPAAPVSKPGFKPRNVKPVSGELSDDAQKTASRPGQDIPSGASQGNTANVPRPAYKPRFNAGKLAENTGKDAEKKKEEIEDTPSVPQATGSGEASASPAEPPKPAYKPRFNVKNIPAKENPSADKVPGTEDTEAATRAAASPGEHSVPDRSSSADDTVKASDGVPATIVASASDPVTKPAYKPRFNLKNTTRKDAEEKEGNSVVKSPSAGTSETEERNSAATQPANEGPESQLKEHLPEKGAAESEDVEVAAPKPAYKARFNAKNIAPKTNEEAPASSSEQPTASGESPAEGSKSADESPGEAAKPAYKPRFNMKNIKPKE